ncbi:TMV resistance protein N-like [Capsicum annuum]|uniref:TMV resistance protein N-like n=1 Tax=Capsicum annuum TaxID=4072 RepID=UPI001FB12E8A|nr:TMV resistance protein N-like [Capsicum annuum]
MMKEEDLPIKFWEEAVTTAVYLINISPTKVVMNRTPYKAWKGRKPLVSHLKVFGCLAYALDTSPSRLKLDSGKVIVSRDVRFNKARSWSWNDGVTSGPTGSLLLDDAHESPIAEKLAPIISEIIEESSAEPSPLRRSTRDRKPNSRYSNSIYTSCQFSLLVSDSIYYVEAAEKEEWQQAMVEEIKDVEKNKTWELVNLPEGKNKHKARLVAKGYEQQQGVDFDETFSPVARFEMGVWMTKKVLLDMCSLLVQVLCPEVQRSKRLWRLEELEHIVKCRNELDQSVILIFYDVIPSYVSHQNSPFAESFSQHEEKYKDDMEKLQRWRETCKRAGKISGYHLQECKDEADCIKKVVDYILPNVISPVSESLVGTQIDKVISLLHMKSNDVRSIGIWGMSSIGKTEIASVIYERYHHQFEAYYFLGDVGEMYRRKGLTWLQKTFIRKLLGKKIVVTSERDGTMIINNELRWKKVFLILDNVDHLSQLVLIVGGTEWFGRGSRILTTAIDKHLIITHVKEDKVYEVLLLSENEALELFCMHAFKRKSPEIDFEEFSSEVVKYADGLPLALKVLGSSVYGRNKEQFRDIIDRLKKIPNDDILGKLKIGLDGLNKDEMRIFLHIACLYNHRPSYEVERIIKSCGIHLIGLRRLIEKSLLSIRNGYMFEMHSLISQMGQNVSREEYTNTKLWLTEEVHDLFIGKMKVIMPPRLSNE